MAAPDDLLTTMMDMEQSATKEPTNIVASPQLTSTIGTSPEQEKQLADSQKADLFEFNRARINIQQLVDQWKPEVLATDGRRNVRDVNINVNALRESGEIKEDETLIPVRVIDTNIKREQPAYINYLRNSRRIAIFKCLSQPNLDTQELERAFTEGMTYPEWEKAHFKCVDGAQTHGWDSIEVVYDERNPLRVGLEQVGHDKLFFSWDALNFQFCGMILRAYDLTITQLNGFVVNFGFSAEQVKLLIEARKGAGIKEEMTIRVYKRQFKYQGVVYVDWSSLQLGTTDWLKNPDKLFLGRKKKQTVMVPTQVSVKIDLGNGQQIAESDEFGQPVMQTVNQPQEQWVDEDETNYPIFVLPYQETEKQRLTDHRGRVYLDSGKQEAQTAVLTGFVNGMTRASNVYASPEMDTNDGGPLKVADVKMVNGTIMTKPMRFFHLDYPDPMVIKAMQFMENSNAQEVGDVNFAALNRQDSRKTATELSQAQNESQKLDSVQLTLFSTHIRLIYGFAWMIAKSQAEQGLLPNFLLIEQEDGGYQQDLNTISQEYDIRAAGDVDVIQKFEMVQQMKNDWPVIQNTPLAQTFLMDMLKLQYPSDSVRYQAILEQGNVKNQAIEALGNLVTELIKLHPEELKTLPPQQIQQLQRVQQLAQKALQSP